MLLEGFAFDFILNKFIPINILDRFYIQFTYPIGIYLTLYELHQMYAYLGLVWHWNICLLGLSVQKIVIIPSDFFAQNFFF